MRTLTKDQAARFILYHQGLLGARKFSGKQGILCFTAQAGCVQFDPVNVCGRSPELTLLSRVAGFEASWLDELLYDSRELIDHFDKNLAIYHRDDWPALARLRARWAQSTHHSRPDEATRAAVLDRIRAQGPHSAATLGLTGQLQGHWGVGTSASRAALEQLYNEGLLLIHSKQGMNKTYDLAENILPPQLLHAPTPHADEAEQTAWHLLRRVRAIGLLWARASDAWLGTAAWYAKPRQAAFERLMKEDQLLPLRVEGMNDLLYVAAVDEPALVASLTLGEQAPRSELIAPLDSLLWDRRLIAALFDFSYTWEIYTKPEKRVYGPYVLPLLSDGRFIGRAGPVLDRKAGTLTLRGLWWEEGTKPGKQEKQALRNALQRLADYHDTKLIFD